LTRKKNSKNNFGKEYKTQVKMWWLILGSKTPLRT